jgi:hypothetical protein
VTAVVVGSGDSLQLDEVEAQRLDARNEPVQRGTVCRVGHEHGAGAGVRRLERIQCGLQHRCQSPLDVEGVVILHVNVQFKGSPTPSMVGVSG